MKPRKSLLVEALRRPESVRGLDPAGWDLLIRQAKRAALTGRLGHVLERENLLADVPERPGLHLNSAWIIAERQHQRVRWEVRQIQRALYRLAVPVVLLKGAAYVEAGLGCAPGRLFWDIDIMVPRAALTDVERALTRHGWVTEQMDAYDQRYYREWMHELPPMHHAKRKATLDVHHTILPPTAGLKPDARRLLAAAARLEGDEDLHVLAPTDMVLHSATHLFHDGELERGLRDLVDLDDLLRQFGADTAFWPALVERAGELDLSRPLYYALRYTTRILDTPVPEATLSAARQGSPGPIARPATDALFTRALVPDHPSCADAFSGLARWLLYVRSHWLRMPPRLLIPHLVRKAIKRRQGGD